MKLRVGLVVLGVVACNPVRRYATVDPTSGRSVELWPSAMPYDTTMSGSFRSPQLGELHLEERNMELYGNYSNEQLGCRVSGSLRGKRTGNEAEFTFAERFVCGTDTGSLGGEGFLFYVEPGPNAPLARLFGERTKVQRIHAGRQWSWLRSSLGAFSAVMVQAPETARSGSSEECP